MSDLLKVESSSDPKSCQVSILHALQRLHNFPQTGSLHLLPRHLWCKVSGTIPFRCTCTQHNLIRCRLTYSGMKFISNVKALWAVYQTCRHTTSTDVFLTITHAANVLLHLPDGLPASYSQPLFKAIAFFCSWPKRPLSRDANPLKWGRSKSSTRKLIKRSKNAVAPNITNYRETGLPLLWNWSAARALPDISATQ